MTDMSCGMAIGIYPLSIRLVLSPEISPKVWSKVWIILMFVTCAGVMIVISSANCSRIVFRFGRDIRWHCRCCIMVCRISVARIKSSGDMGSPCLKPLW
jgi:hypothetical protein